MAAILLAIPRWLARERGITLIARWHTNQKTGDRIAAISRLVPGAGLEPARPFGSTDFKSVVSTNSTIQAVGLFETEQI